MAKPEIKLLVACCSMLSRLGLREILSGERVFVIVKETDNVDDVIQWARKGVPDIILLCFHLFMEGKTDFIAKIKERTERPKLVIFDSNFTQEQELQLIKEGVVGILRSNCDPATFIKALKRIYEGEF